MAKLQKSEISGKLEKSPAKKKVTLSIDSEVYDRFRKYCEENAIMLSKKVELFMKGEVEKDSEGEK